MEVLADGDVLRGERLTRSLHTALVSAEGLQVRLPTALGPMTGGGAKGAEIIADASMWVFLTAGAQAGARILVTAIQAWAEQGKHRTVRVTRGDHSIEIPSVVTPAQERAIEAFLRDDER
ncbi:hypothetical protein [Actinoplanes sp. NPDC051851]|uniref:hypothetical protein n=1 Tax=Actinoplanes sp. NPDC051851 TaxID=3154753 RepID=UPI0034287F8B